MVAVLSRQVREGEDIKVKVKKHEKRKGDQRYSVLWVRELYVNKMFET